MTSTQGRAVTYGRQSKQREDASDASPQAQQKAASALVAARGWTHVGHFEDVGRSGYDPRASRPGLDALLAEVRAARVQHVVVYKLDRLTRRGVVEASRLVGLLAENGASLASVQEPFLDTSTAMGRGIFGLFAAMAEQESENISSRTTAAKEVLRAAGSFAGGRPPYGTAVVREVRGSLTVNALRLVPEEAAIIRGVARRVLDGASIASQVRRLNAEGTLTRYGSEWSPSTLCRVLSSPALAGFQPERRRRNGKAHSFEIVPAREDDGTPRAVGDAVVPPEEWWRLQTVIASRANTGGVVEGSTRGGAAVVPTLLGGGGLLVCGECGGRMGGQRRNGGFSGAYRCSRHRRSSTLCSGTSVAMALTDEYVARSVFERLGDLDPAEPADAALLLALGDRFAEERRGAGMADAERMATAMLHDVGEAQERLDDDRAAGIFAGESGTARYRRQALALAERGDAARATLAAARAEQDNADDLSGVLDAVRELAEHGVDGAESPWQVWQLPHGPWTLAERRAFLALFFDRVEVVGSRRHAGGNYRWLPEERLRLCWFGAVPF